MNPARRTRAPNTPQNSTRNWYSAGTAKYDRITAQTKTLSTDRLFSIKYPARYSPAAAPPCQKRITRVNESPMAIQIDDSIAASRKVMTWGRRWTRSRSPTSRMEIPMMKATQTHPGTSKSTYVWPFGSSAAKRGVKGSRPIRSLASFPGRVDPDPDSLAVRAGGLAHRPTDSTGLRTGRRSIRRQDDDLPVGGYSPPKRIMVVGSPATSVHGADEAGAGGAPNHRRRRRAEPEPLPAGEALGPQDDQLRPGPLEVVEDRRRGFALFDDDLHLVDLAVEGVDPLGGPLLSVGSSVLDGQNRHPGRPRQGEPQECTDGAHGVLGSVGADGHLAHGVGAAGDHHRCRRVVEQPLGRRTGDHSLEQAVRAQAEHEEIHDVQLGHHRPGIGCDLQEPHIGRAFDRLGSGPRRAPGLDRGWRPPLDLHSVRVGGEDVDVPVGPSLVDDPSPGDVRGLFAVVAENEERSTGGNGDGRNRKALLLGGWGHCTECLGSPLWGARRLDRWRVRGHGPVGRNTDRDLFSAEPDAGHGRPECLGAGVHLEAVGPGLEPEDGGEHDDRRGSGPGLRAARGGVG